ncbi:MAG: HAD-IIIA family hydrolase [Candidatus Omnitrophota bacterium]
MQTVKQRAKKIKLLLLDVDGVLTDGRIIYDNQGRDLKVFDVHDGMGIYLLSKLGIKTILISARSSGTIHKRAKDMSVYKVFENAQPKSRVLETILKSLKIKSSQVCFVGDDLVDLCLMRRVGLSVAVKNSCPQIKSHAHYITKKTGGRGAVREVTELILKAQGKWAKAVESYLKQ